jgi:sterol desaturase/sphingolipid hydroxylase (fatty acid hydroxylase superfamily)
MPATGAPTVPATLIEEHRWLLRIFGAASLTPVLAFAAALSAALVWLGTRGPLPGAGVPALLMTAGAVYWTFAEYAVHRWFYHWRPRHRGLRRLVESFHVYHHRTPDDRAVWHAGPALVLLVLAVMGPPVLLVLRDLQQTALVMAGATVAYALYEVAHHAFHARVYRKGPMRFLQALHLHHHDRNWGRNFGVTSPLWDLILGSFARPLDR